MNTSKKSFLFVTLFIVCHVCFAQEISIRGGFNLSQMPMKVNGIDITDYPKLKPGFHFGPTFNLSLNTILSLETGILYSTKGMTSKHTMKSDGSLKLLRINLTYLESPLNLKVKILSRNLTFVGIGGGYFAPALFGKFVENLDLNNAPSVKNKVNWEEGQSYAIKRIDYGVNIGFETIFSDFKIGISYMFGLANLSYNHVAGFNRNLEIYLSYQLWSK